MIYEHICKAAKGYGFVAGFNVFGYEDTLELVRAAEDVNAPILLMTNRDASNVMDIEHWAKMLGSIANRSKAVVGVHLDHCSDLQRVLNAIDYGYTSVMYDGSKLPIEQNIENTKKVVDYAHKRGVIVEAEIGNVPYSDLGQTNIELSSVEEAIKIANESGVDMLAVSVGNIHRLTEKAANLNFELLKEIQDAIDIPLVIHGASGIAPDDFEKLKEYGVGKINVGTSIRMTFGQTLREQFEQNPNEFDRLKLFAAPREAVYKKACEILKNISGKEIK